MASIAMARRLRSMASKVRAGQLTPTVGDIELTGLLAWTEKGIVGRGILVDYHSWRLEQTDPAYSSFDAFETTPISLKDLKACLHAQGTEVNFGDILIIRSGTYSSHCLSIFTTLF